MTLQKRFERALIARGESVVKRDRKRVTLTRNAVPGTFYYLGTHGALRFGRTFTTSWAVSEAWRSALYDESREAEEK